MKFVVLAGRILFSLIFIMSGFSHFKDQTIQYATSHGVLMPHLLVPAAGVMAILGGVSIAFGFKTKSGAWLLVAFLVPVTLTMHNFWSVNDPQEHQMQMAMFMKNISMLGGALLISYFGAGPLSIDSRKNHST
jgi:putative oxidoreductase